MGRASFFMVVTVSGLLRFPLGTATSNIAVAGILRVIGSGLRGDYHTDPSTDQWASQFPGQFSVLPGRLS